MMCIAILVLYLAWVLTSALFVVLLGCSEALAGILGLVGPVGLFWLCVRSSN